MITYARDAMIEEVWKTVLDDVVSYRCTTS